MTYPSPRRLTGLLLAAGFVAGCAGNPIEPSQQALVRAEAAVEEAEQSGAYEHGSAELESARDKLFRARTAAEAGDEEIAERLAAQAALDAELAAAITSNQEMQTAVDELNASLETLRQELQRAR